MKFTSIFSFRLIIYSLLLFTNTFTIVTAQNATDSLVIQNDSNKSTVPIVKKKVHNPIRTPIIIVSTLIGIAIIVFLQYPGKSKMK